MAGGLLDLAVVQGVWLQSPAVTPPTGGFVSPLAITGVWIDGSDGTEIEDEAGTRRQRQIKALTRSRRRSR